MRWLFRILDRRTTRQYESELRSFLAVLHTLTSHEMAELVILADHVRQGLVQAGNDVNHPSELAMRNASITDDLVRSVVSFQKNGNPLAASAMAVWAHTMRCVLRPELHPLRLQMWREIGRGFDSIDAVLPGLRLRLQTDFQPGEARTYPEGCRPVI